MEPQPYTPAPLDPLPIFFRLFVAVIIVAVVALIGVMFASGAFNECPPGPNAGSCIERLEEQRGG